MKVTSIFKLLAFGVLALSGSVYAQEKRFMVQLEPGYVELKPRASVQGKAFALSSQSESSRKISIIRTEQVDKVNVFKALSKRSDTAGRVSPQSLTTQVTWATIKAQGFSNASELESYLKQTHAGVAYVEEDLFVKTSSLATEEPLTRGAWQYSATAVSPGGSNIFSAWLRATGQGVVVAVLDNGVTDHPDLRATLSSDRATFIEDEDPLLAEPGFSPGLVCDRDAKISWHGTEMQGVIAGALNGEGVVGVAHNSRVIPVRVLGACGGWLSDIARGVRWASGESVDSKPAPLQPAKVINLSLGSPGFSCPAYIQSAIDAATARGAVVVASAGNTGEASLNYPAACNNVVAVAAHTFTGDRANYSAYSSQVAIAAPGGGGGVLLPFVGPGLNTTSNSGVLSFGSSNYAVTQGTSPAAAIVSGAIALAKELEPSLTVDQVKEMLRSTARPWPANTACLGNSCGPGLLDVFAFLNAIDPPVDVNPPVVQPVSAGLPNTIRASDSLVVAWDVTSSAAGVLIYSVEVRARDGQFASVPFTLTPLTPSLSFRVPSDWSGRAVDLILTATNIFGQRTTSTQTVEVQSASVTAPTPPPSVPQAPSSGGSGSGGGGSLNLLGLLGLAALMVLKRKVVDES